MASRGRRVVDHADVVRALKSMVPGMSTMPKGAGWKTPMVSRVSMMSMVSRLSIISEGMPDGIVGRDRHSAGGTIDLGERRRGASERCAYLAT